MPELLKLVEVEREYAIYLWLTDFDQQIRT